jgi:geranylgeranyl diphosphate synthase type I
MIPRILAAYRGTIESAVRDALAGETSLRAMLRYHIGIENEDGSEASAMGKLLRPSLVLWSAEGLGARVDEALPAAIALELIHNFSLVHDDIQDRDRTRRGRATLWTLHGEAEAINAGDLMETLAFRRSLAGGMDAAECLVEATAEMIEGQSLDLAFERRAVSVDEYASMIDRKTGALLRCALELGGIAAKADRAVRGELRTLGVEIGRAFQIRDDLLGVWGDADVVGKPHGSDIRRRKNSFPIAAAFTRAEGADRQRLAAIYALPGVGDDEVRWVIDLLDRLGVRDEGSRRVEEHLATAKASLGRLPLPAAARGEMVELIEFLARREK